ncbi:MAG TPA: M50 family metallopeptidase [Kofleriaceae bacterium]
MLTLVAVVACIALLGAGELARYLVARMLGVPVVRVAKCFVGLRGGRRWARVVAIAAGTLTTYLGIVVLALAFYLTAGVPTGNLEVIVDSIVVGYPAQGKLEAGDRITAVDGAPLTRSLNLTVDGRNGAPVTLTFHRHGERREVTLTPIGHDGHWLLGLHPLVDQARSYEAGLAVRRAIGFPIEQVKALLPPPSDSADPGGPKRIVDTFRPPPATLTARTLRHALVWATYLLLIVVVVDIVRAARAVRATA